MEGFDGRIVPLGTEREPPYERPPPSKGCLLGDAAREEARVHDQGSPNGTRSSSRRA